MPSFSIRFDGREIHPSEIEYVNYAGPCVAVKLHGENMPLSQTFKTAEKVKEIYEALQRAKDLLKPDSGGRSGSLYDGFI